jgi:hypothetical protein
VTQISPKEIVKLHAKKRVSLSILHLILTASGNYLAVIRNEVDDSNKGKT